MKNKIDFLDTTVEIVSYKYNEDCVSPEIKIAYLLEGNVILKIRDDTYNMLKDDIVVINTNTPHSITTQNGSVLVLIKLSFFKLCRILDTDYVMFWCNSKKNNNHKYESLRKIINKLVFAEIESEGRESFKKYGLQCNLVDHLLGNFKVNETTYQPESRKTEKQLAYILNYIQTHYMEKITLSDISEKLYKSVSSLSRFFQKSTGVSFVDYLKEFRIQKVTESLLYSNEAITKIAVDNGFSSPSNMNKAFFDSYRMTPSDFRSKFKDKAIGNSNLKLEDHEKEKILDILSIKDAPLLQIKKVKANSTVINRYNTCINNILNVGSAYNLLTSDMQDQVKFVLKELNIRTIKIWNIFSNRFMIKENNDYSNKELNFENIDRIFDFCIKNNILLFLDLGSRQETVMTGEQSFLYKKEENITFNSFDEWTEFLCEFLKHLIKRYGTSVISKWVFELPVYFNSPKYLDGNDKDFQLKWGKIVTLIKTILPECKIAGPGLIVFSDKKRTEIEIKKIITSHTPPDIFTMIAFPYMAINDGDNTHLKRISNSDFFKTEIEIASNILVENGFNNKIWITEWNNSISNRNHIQDSCYRGTFILKNILDTADLIDSYGYWYTSDLINVYFDSKNILNGSAGLLTKNGICKPAFYALNFFSRLGEYILIKTDECIITSNNRNSYRVICFNHLDLTPSYFINDESKISPRQVEKYFEDGENMELQIEISNMEDGNIYSVHQEIINTQNGSILDKWIELDCEPELSLKEITYLRRTCVPKFVKEKIMVTDGVLSLDVKLEPHEMRFIHITLNH
ncbi:TPA: helix-turn-helix domain-containing protein [Klebsiella oxytoca]